MRRVFAIGLAIVIVMIASRGVVAQEDSVSDRLLEILKDRQIISNDEFGELKGLAAEMKEDRADLDRRLGDLDRSIADYLAEGGNATAAGVTYSVGNGFTFTTSDNLFSLTIGGLFQFWYQGTDRDRDPFGKGDPFPAMDRRDVNRFHHMNRFHFVGHAFMEELNYYFEFEATSGVTLYEGYVDYNVCGWTNVRVGHFRAPFGRQNLIHVSDLTAGRAFQDFTQGQTPPVLFGDYTWLNGPARDDGVMFHNMYTDMFGMDGLAAEYMMGFFNGGQAVSNNWVAPAFRLVLYPLGPVAYVEGDWTGSQDPRAGIGCSYSYDRGRLDRGHEVSSAWGVDGVVVWSGLYLTAEWQRFKQDDRTGGTQHVRAEHQRQWFVQAGFMVMPRELELFLRYAKRGTQIHGWKFGEGQYKVDNTIEWVAGVAYYIEGHSLKGILEIGQLNSEIDGAVKGVTKVPDDAKIFFVRIIFQLEW